MKKENYPLLFLTRIYLICQNVVCLYLFLQELVQLGLAVLDPPLVCRVDHPDEPVRGLEVVPPVGAERLLPAHVPDVEAEPVVLHSLDVEAQRGRDGVHVLAVELLQHCRLAGVVQTSEMVVEQCLSDTSLRQGVKESSGSKVNP